MPSTVPAALANLVALIGGHPAFAGVQVSYVDPDYVEEHEVVAVGTPEGVDLAEELITGEPGVQTEAYRIPVRVKVWDETGDPPGVVARIWELYDGILDVVAANPTLDGALVHQPMVNVRLAEQQGIRGGDDRGVVPAVDASGNRAGWISFLNVDVEVSDLIYPT